MKKFAAILLSLVLTLTVALADSIYVVSREDGSGTRAAFIELTGVEQKDADGNKVDMTTVEAAVYSGTSEVKTTVSQDVAAIGYISLGSMDASVKALKVARNPEDGAEAVYVEATPENVASGDYAIARPFNIAYKADNLSATAQDFINWILSAEGQAIVTAQKYVAKEPAEYQAAPVAGKIVIGGSSSVGPLMQKLEEAYEALHPEVDSFPVHFFHHQHSAHPARRVSAACALHFGGEGHVSPGVSVLYLCKPCAGHLHDADAQHCTQQQTDCIPSRGPAFPPDQQAEDNKNCRRRQQKPHLRQK